MTVNWIGGRRAGLSLMASTAELAAGGARLMSDPNHWMIRHVGGAKVRAGVSVNEHSAMALPAAFAAVKIVASAMAQVPLQLMRRAPGVNGRMNTLPATDHPLYEIMSRRPNERMTSYKLRQTVFGHAVGWGNGFGEIERRRSGEVVGVWPLLPDRTEPRLEAGNLIYDTQVDGQSFRIPSADVLHLSGFGWDGYKGYSPIRQAREAIGLGLAAEAFGAGFFGNDAKSGGVLIHPGKLTDGAKGRVRDDFDKQGGLDNAHRIKVLEEGMKFVPTTIPPEDAQFLGTQEFTVAQVARIFGVPLFLLHSHEKATSWGSGLEQMMIAFVTFTLAGWAEGAEQEMDAKLLTAQERAAGYYFKFNLNAFLRGDTAARTAMYKAMIDDGWGNRNEVRALEDLNPEDGLDAFLMPQNRQTVAQAEETHRLKLNPPAAPSAPAQTQEETEE